MYALLIQQHARHDQESENSHFLAEVDQAAIAPLSVFFAQWKPSAADCRKQMLLTSSD